MKSNYANKISLKKNNTTLKKDTECGIQEVFQKISLSKIACTKSVIGIQSCWHFSKMIIGNHTTSNSNRSNLTSSTGIQNVNKLKTL